MSLHYFFYFLKYFIQPLFYACRLFYFDWLDRSPDDVTCTTKHAKVTIRLIENQIEIVVYMVCFIPVLYQMLNVQSLNVTVIQKKDPYRIIMISLRLFFTLSTWVIQSLQNHLHMLTRITISLNIKRYRCLHAEYQSNQV